MEAEEQPVKKKRQSSRRAPKKESTGDSKMRSEASRALRENGETIANALAKKAADGDLKCIELLYKLSKDTAAQDASSDGPALRRSYAVRFAVEPEWTGDAKEAGAQEMDASTEPVTREQAE
ncbi:MAG: hypothetical protein P4L40_13850 [Terracidiphilus sp.]|nr:hypothetical protein [Terracidiphilus sp.]